MTKTKTKKKPIDHTTAEEWRQAAQRELHPELDALHVEREAAIVHRDALRPPVEPDRTEIAPVAARLRDAWSDGDTGADVIDGWHHDWFTDLRRKQVGFAAGTTALRMIDGDIATAETITDDHIEWLDRHARRLIDEARADTSDLNLRRDKRTSFTALIGAYAGFAVKLGLDRDDIDGGFAWIDNIAEVSARHRAHLAGLTDWRNRAEPWGTRRDAWFDFVIRTPEAQVKLRTPDEARAIRDQMLEAGREANWPKRSRYRPIDRSRGDTDATHPPVPRTSRW